ncbi:hypothetical protein pdam_00006324 [Pocillopora damicornis]|uniref:Calponin-homology (CH) domain-containing protein n=1 Tax=Pocillopora damicornis TaxID=46731 RepID=A0A3M6UT33_POCDA|nr:hypothetical protein pdam_00006324 [Pocillopora damicornis]
MSGNIPLERCFKEAEETGRLNLSQKNLRDFPDPTDDCELIDVIEIDLSRNKLSEFPAELCDFLMIERVDLYHNTIRGVPESQMSELKFLRVLNLRRNQITTFPSELCSLPLQVLNLSNNKLTSLPVEIGHLTLLQDLDLNIRRNRLEVLPDELSKLKLVRLDFSYNKVSVIPPAYRLITSLSVLELAHNPLTSPPAQVCTKGKLHIFKYLSATAHEQEKRRTFDRDVVRKYSFPRSSSEDAPENHLMIDRVRRTHSLDLARNAAARETYEKEVYRPSSLRERERTRPPLSNVFETEEKRREIQKEIERAQQLLADAHEVEDDEVQSKPDEEYNEGEELLKIKAWPPLQASLQRIFHSETLWPLLAVLLYAFLNPGTEFLQIEAEQRRKKEEEERQVEERRSAARKLQTQHEEIQQQRQAEVRRKMESKNATPDQNEGYFGYVEEELRARKREQLMQQSRREAQLSRLRFEEERMKRFSGKSSAATVSFNGSEAPSQNDGGVQDREAWEELVYTNIHTRQKAPQVRSLPATFRDQNNPNFTIKRMYDSAREEFEQLERLREGIESRLKVALPDDLPASLADGVVLCHLINHIRKGLIPSIHIPSAGVPKLTMPKCQKNVDYFLEACRKLGVDKEKLCTPSDILEEKSPLRVCQTVESLLEHADGGV